MIIKTRPDLVPEQGLLSPQSFIVFALHPLSPFYGWFFSLFCPKNQVFCPKNLWQAKLMARLNLLADFLANSWLVIVFFAPSDIFYFIFTHVLTGSVDFIAKFCFWASVWFLTSYSFHFSYGEFGDMYECRNKSWKGY